MSRSRTLPRHRRLFIRRRSRLTTALLAVAAIVVAACEPENEPPRKDYSDIKVEWVTFGHEVPFTATSAELTAADMAGLEAFLGRIEIRLTDQIALDPGAGADPELATARADELSRRLRANLPGVQIRVLEAGTGSAPHLVVGRYIAVQPECSGWYSPEQRYAAFANPDNKTDANFGCSTARNLAEMIADPGDLVQGRSLAPAPSQPSSIGITRYLKLESPHPHTRGMNKSTHTEIE